MDLTFYSRRKFWWAISPNQAIQLALKYHASISYDEKAQAPFFHYKDEENNEHMVWFEDARSINAKFSLIKDLQLMGISY